MTAFADRVKTTGAGLIADLGCGPGRVTAFLDELGMETYGLDLSPSMIATAEDAYPHLRFRVGSIEAFEIDDRSLGGIVAWYSIIHTPPELLPRVFDEFARVLRTDGQILLAFQVGDERVHLQRAYGHDVSLDAYRSRPARIRELLEHAGLDVDTTVCREPVNPERSRQAYLMAARRS